MDLDLADNFNGLLRSCLALSSKIIFDQLELFRLFFFGFIAFFLGQSIPFREHRQSQKLILQLTILLTFILGTAFQSILIALLADPGFEKRITSIEEMVNRNFSYYAHQTFVDHLGGSDYYQKMKAKMTVLTDKNPLFLLSEAFPKKAAIIDYCSQIDFALDNAYYLQNSPHLEGMENYYKIDEKFNSFYLQMVTSRYSFYQESLHFSRRPA